MTIRLPLALSEAHAAAVRIPDRAAYVDGLVGLRDPVNMPTQPSTMNSRFFMFLVIGIHEPCRRTLRETRGDRDASHR